MKTIALEKGEERSKAFEEGSNGKGSNDASRCIHHSIASLHLPFVAHYAARAPATAEKRKQRKNACTFSSFFSPSLSFLPEQPVREERVKGDAAPYLRQPRVSPRPYLSLPAFLLPLLFYLRSKTGRTGGGTKKKRRGARLQV